MTARLGRLLPPPPGPPLRPSPAAVAVPSRARVFWRAVQVLWVAARFARGWRADQRITDEPKRREREIRRARWLKDQLVMLGPTFIKIGQALSTRVDLLPLTYVDEMAVLQDRIPPFDTALARTFIEEELGKPVEAVFKDFPAAPLAAASLGQVYHTWLHTGEEVAVKVQRPELLQAFAVDLAVLRYMAHYVETKTDWLRDVELLDILDEFGRKLHEEVDYLREADNADRFRANFEGFKGVVAPRMYRAYSSRRVLTMEFMHGTKVTNTEWLAEMGLVASELVATGARVNLKQLLEDGFYHADLHPGNILVDRAGNLIFVDFGLVGEISRSMRAQMVEAFLHIVDRDIDALVQDLILLGFLRPGQDPGPLKPTLAWIIDSSMTPMARRPTFKEMTDPMAEIFYKYHLRVPVTFSFVFRTLISLEGIGMLLDPGFHPFDVVIPYAAKLMLSEAGEDIRERLASEIFTPTGLNWNRLFELVDLARRDPGFKLGEVPAMGLEWLVSREGRAMRDKLLDELLGDDPIPWEQLERLIDLAQTDPTFDLMATVRPLINWLLTPPAEPFRTRLLWKIGKDLMTGRLGEWAGIYKVVRALL
ncbi:MAG: family kinaselike protein [Cyanobacteria bacterium RYN_339]|nr:family kinaselike protein [Cyanobacteria bacterium RYN_339]